MSGASRRSERAGFSATSRLASGVAFLAILLSLGFGAEAQPLAPDNPTSGSASLTIDAPAPVSGSKIGFGETSGVPRGYYDYCVRVPGACHLSAGVMTTTHDGSVVMTGATMAQITKVNAAVNAAIRPALRDDWTPGMPEGDCKDFAMTKRQRLIASGWPSSALPLAIVRTAQGEQHLILVARTSQGDFLLDNLTSEIRPWSTAPYSWEKIQSTTEALAWRQVRSY